MSTAFIMRATQTVPHFSETAVMFSLDSETAQQTKSKKTDCTNIGRGCVFLNQPVQCQARPNYPDNTHAHGLLHRKTGDIAERQDTKAFMTIIQNKNCSWVVPKNRDAVCRVRGSGAHDNNPAASETERGSACAITDACIKKHPHLE